MVLADSFMEFLLDLSQLPSLLLEFIGKCKDACLP